MTQHPQPEAAPPQFQIVTTLGMTIPAWEATKASMEHQGFTYDPTMTVFTRPVAATEEQEPTPLASARHTKASQATATGGE